MEDKANQAENKIPKKILSKAFELTLYDKLLSVISQLMILAPSHLTAFLAIYTRYIQIKYSFRLLKMKIVLMALMLSQFWAPSVVTCYFLSPNYFTKLQKQYAIIGSMVEPHLFDLKTLPTIIFFPTLILQFIAIGSSFFATYELVKSHLKPTGQAPRRNNTKRTIRILVTNIGSVVTLLCYTIIVAGDFEASREDTGGFNFDVEMRLLVSIQLMPALVSALNRVTYILFILMGAF